MLPDPVDFARDSGYSLNSPVSDCIYYDILSTAGEVTLRNIVCFRCRDGRRINILKQVGENYYNFGVFLLNDDNGNEVDIIKENNKGDIVSIVREIVKKWLAGTGMPVSWKTLISVFEDIELKDLADKIKSATVKA